MNKAINISIYNVFNPANKNIFEQYDHEGHCLAVAGGTFSWFFDGCERCRGIFAEYWLNRRPCCLNGTGEDEKRRPEYVRGDRKSSLSPIERCEWRNAKGDARTVPASHTEGTALKDLLMLAGKRKGKLIASCLLLILNAGLAVIPFLLVYRLLLGLFNPPFNLWKMWYLVAAIPVVYIIANALLICAYDLSHRAAFEILYEIRLRLGERMVQMPLGYYAGKNTGEFETVMNESVERLEFFWRITFRK